MNDFNNFKEDFGSYEYLFINQNFSNLYNDLKLPMDSRKGDANRSYGFINFRHPLFLLEFYKEN